MTIKKVFYSLVFLFPLHCLSQSAKVDTIPFTLTKKLLVFTGNINGKPVDFAFDTGAALGVANSSIDEKVNFTVKNGKKGIVDANLQTIKIKKIEIRQLNIGSYQFKNIKSLLHDVEYLQCNELYLLGIDVIGKLNWKINFITKTLLVSETAFTTDTNLIALPVTYKGKRPITTLTLGNYAPQKCLIDFGYTGIVEISESADATAIFIKKQQQGLATTGLSSAMALSGLGQADTVKNIKIDSLFIGSTLFKKVPLTISEKTDCKIGVGFFASYCNQVVLNHTTDTYYFDQTSSPLSKLNNFDARVTYTNGKLIITAKNLSATSTAAGLSIGDEIKSIDGKTFADFKNNCDFLNSYYLNNNNQLTIEKLNGEKIILYRQQIN